jgi:hypothetical protein
MRIVAISPASLVDLRGLPYGHRQFGEVGAGHPHRDGQVGPTLLFRRDPCDDSDPSFRGEMSYRCRVWNAGR